MFTLLTAAAFFTALLSATVGMAGGLVLLGVYTAVLPVEVAMVLHGVTQLFANGLRAAAHARSVRWPVVGNYALGAAVAWLLLRPVATTPSATAVYLALGALPFIARLVRGAWALDIGRRPHAVLAGAVVAGVQVIAGAAGPLLDLFVLDTRLDRHEIVATKSATQTLAHVAKIAWFAPLLGVGDTPAPDLVGGVLVGAALGTAAGSWLLDRWSDAGFQAASRGVVLAVGGVYLTLGLGRVLAA